MNTTISDRKSDYQKLQLFTQAAAKIGSRYLSYGGPTSRLEDQLYNAGITHRCPVEVFATPTGVFITAYKKKRKHQVTILDRSKSSDLNLSALSRTEKVLDMFARGILTPEETLDLIEHYDKNPLMYSKTIILLGALFVGFGASFLKYGLILEGVVSGLLNIFITWYFFIFLKGKHLTGIFKDFLSSFTTFVLSAILGYLLNTAPEVFALGSLIMLVPGLTITTAISELADHNFVSGNVKLVKGLLTVMAMGVAYLIVSDLSNLFVFVGTDVQLLSPPTNHFGLNLNINIFAISILGSSLMFHVPYKAIPGAILTGVIGWFTILQFEGYPNFVVLAPFLSSFFIGTVGLILGRFSKLPSQIFTLPGILPLVPGLLALNSFNHATSDPYLSESLAFKVAVTSSSIVFGLLTSRIPFHIIKNVSNKQLP